MKQCNRCKEWKPYTEFFLNKHMPDGHINQCKNCYSKKRKTVACEDIKCKYFHAVPRECSATCDLGGELKFFIKKLHWRGLCPLTEVKSE